MNKPEKPTIPFEVNVKFTSGDYTVHSTVKTLTSLQDPRHLYHLARSLLSVIYKTESQYEADDQSGGNDSSEEWKNN